MAEYILSIFVYLLGLVIIVTIVNSAIALFQIIEDIPSVRKKIWSRHNRGFRTVRNNNG